VKQSNQSRQKANRLQQFFFAARTRILAWYVILMAFFIAVSVLAIQQILLARLEERVERSLVQEIEEFRRLAQGLDPTTSQPFGNDVKSIFEVFLDRNIPDDDEFLLALVDGQLYRSSPQALPEPLKPGSQLLQRWARLTRPEQGEILTSIGNILYLAEPVKVTYAVEPVQVRNKTWGVFVVAYSTIGEQQEVKEAVLVVIRVMATVLLAASILAWIAAGRVLAPLRLLTETARSISDSDLTARIPVQGADEIAELTRTFNEMLERLQAAFASQRNFINDAGHELRTPITIIRGHLELLGDDPQERQETIELVTDELDRMSRFVSDLLLLAKAEQPDFLALKPVDLALLTDELFAKAQALAPRAWRLEAQASGQGIGDRQRLTQAIMNLAQNATQHTHPGDVIALGSAVAQGEVRFWVRDTGTGIAPADQQRIFERFARAANSRRRSEGAGLGLSIVQAIAQAHGGRVELVSHPGAGATFTLVIPLALAQESTLDVSNP
jgi:signal transduction histidine kinase